MHITGRSKTGSVIRLKPKNSICLCRTVFSLARSRESCCSPRCDVVGPEGLAKEGLGKTPLFFKNHYKGVLLLIG